MHKNQQIEKAIPKQQDVMPYGNIRRKRNPNPDTKKISNSQIMLEVTKGVTHGQELRLEMKETICILIYWKLMK